MVKKKLVIFDLWSTLAYNKGNKQHSSMKEIISKTNSKIPINDLIQIFENSVQTKKWKSERAAYEAFCKKMDIEFNEKNINILIKARRKSERRPALYRYSLPMLKKLKSLEYKVAIISNTSIFVIDGIRKLGLFDYVDFLIFSYNIGVIKPDKRIYKEALMKAKVSADEAIMVGDNLENDVMMPRGLGIDSIHFRNFKKLKKDLKEFNIRL